MGYNPTSLGREREEMETIEITLPSKQEEKGSHPHASGNQQCQTANPYNHFHREKVKEKLN